MHTNPNAVELLRLRDELDALEQSVPEEWGFRVAVVIAFLLALLFFVDALEAFPLAILAGLFGFLVLAERRARRSRLLDERARIENRIRMIEESGHEP